MKGASFPAFEVTPVSASRPVFPAVNGTYADAMASHETISKAEAARVLNRVGYSKEKIVDIMSELKDPIDIDRDAAVLEKYGITRDALEDLMGGSP
jgi:hypothetical protein